MTTLIRDAATKSDLLDTLRATAALAEQVRQAAAGPASATPLLARFPELPRRLAALRAFAESAYFRGVLGEAGGYPQETCDARVAEILSQGA